MESFRSNSSKNDIVDVNTLNESQIDKFVQDAEKNVDMESLRVLLTVRTLFFSAFVREFTSTHTHSQNVHVLKLHMYLFVYFFVSMIERR